MAWFRRFSHHWQSLDSLQKYSTLGLVVTTLALLTHLPIFSPSPTLNHPTNTVLGDTDTNPESLSCSNSSGSWRTFNNGCADLCATQTSTGRPNPDIGCTQALTDSCDCGPDACWTGTSCQPFSNPDTPTITDPSPPDTFSFTPTCNSPCFANTDCQSDSIRQSLSLICYNDPQTSKNLCRHHLNPTDPNCAYPSSDPSDITDPTTPDTSAPVPLDPPVPAPPPPGDFNQDYLIDITDRELLLDNLFATKSTYDLNQDGVVDLTDYSLWVYHFLNSQPQS